MTRTRRKPDPVRPSATDPVDAWLDVLVSMLSIPKTDRQRVRDELEDHLRSRIDDLLIHGLTEPQALEKAVAELGETADLARQLSHAHRLPRTRRFAMHTLLIALTGTVVALGVNTIRPKAVAPVTADNQAVLSDAPGQHEPRSDLLAVSIPVPPGGQLNTLELLERLAAQANLELEIDRPAIDEFDPGWLWHVFSYPHSHGGSTTLASLMTMESDVQPLTHNPNRIVVSETAGTLLVTTVRGMDIRSTSRSVYPLARFAENAPDPQMGAEAEAAYDRLMRAVTEHVSPMDWKDNGGDLATITVLGSSMIVTAPSRIHEQIDALLSDLHEQSIIQRMERERSDADRRRHEIQANERLVARLKDEYEHASAIYLEAVREISRLQAERNAKLVESSTASETDDKLAIALGQIDSEIRAKELQSEEQMTRMRYLRSRLIAGEYEHLFSGLPTSHQPPVALPPEAFRIEGAVNRPGDYKAPATGTMTLKRFIDAAGGVNASISRIHIQRDGELFLTVEGEYLAEQGDIAIRPGDRVTVLAKTQTPTKPGQN